jgi:drug/metabolite transporter (DMT)-like permease
LRGLACALPQLILVKTGKLVQYFGMSKNLTHLWPGVPLALGSAALFGATAPLSKLLGQSLSPWLLAGLLYAGAGLGLLAVRLLFGSRNETPLQRKDWPWLGGAILFGGILGPVFLMFGIAKTTASAASLMLNFESVATMLIAWLVLRENVDRRLLLGAGAILAGALVLSWQGGFVFDQGSMLIVLACLCWGIDNNLARQISAADPVESAMIKGLAAGAVNLTLAFSLGAALPSAPIIAASLFTGFICIGASLVMFMLALRHLGTARTAAYYAFAPFIGAALSVAVLSEPLTLQLMIAGALMAIGLWLHLAERHDHDHHHHALDHDHAHSHGVDQDGHHTHSHDQAVEGVHSHPHHHAPMQHRHVHYPDLHHRHEHESHPHETADHSD